MTGTGSGNVEQRELSAEERDVAYAECATGIEKEILRFSVQISCLRGEEPTDAGSGVIVDFGTKVFVMTAAHVLQDYDVDSIWLLPKMGGSVQNRIPVQRIGRWGGKTNDPVDAGYIEIRREDCAKLGLEALPLRRLARDWTKHQKDFTVLCGFPVELLKIRKAGKRSDLHWKPATILTLLESLEKWAGDANPATDIEVAYPEGYASSVKSGRDVRLPNPNAMSGGGLWAFPLGPRTEVWSASRGKLIGTLCCWHKADRWLLAKRVEHFVGLVHKDYPELRDSARAWFVS